MSDYLAEAEMTSEDWRLVHSFRNTWALRRRKRLSKPLRARIDGDIERLLARATERRIEPALLKVWRAYPSRDADGNLAFALTAASSESKMTVRVEAPPSEADLKRARRRDDPPAVPAAELMERLEHAIGTAVQ